jgi:hypothetical protein
VRCLVLTQTLSYPKMSLPLCLKLTHHGTCRNFAARSRSSPILSLAADIFKIPTEACRADFHWASCVTITHPFCVSGIPLFYLSLSRFCFFPPFLLTFVVRLVGLPYRFAMGMMQQNRAVQGTGVCSCYRIK